MANWAVLTWDKGIWREYLDSTYTWVREHLRPEDDPDSFYLLVSNVDRTLDVDLSSYKRLVLILDDPAKRYPVSKLINPPEKRVSLWYGLDRIPSAKWCNGFEIISGLHLWDAYPYTIPEKSPSDSERYDVFLCGNCKRERARRLSQLLAGVSVSCLGYNWGDYFPVDVFKPRTGSLLDEATEASAECVTELVYHSPSVKSFLSLRLPNILRRGHVPLVDLDHDPKRLLLITDKFRDNLYANTPEEVREACRFAKTVTRDDIQKEYDAQVERAERDLSTLRKKLSA